jgi:hypothetical protein
VVDNESRPAAGTVVGSRHHHRHHSSDPHRATFRRAFCVFFGDNYCSNRHAREDNGAAAVAVVAVLVAVVASAGAEDHDDRDTADSPDDGRAGEDHHPPVVDDKAHCSDRVEGLWYHHLAAVASFVSRIGPRGEGMW